jgi:vacuolar-type H+-ATPase subunit B/Vma2
MFRETTAAHAEFGGDHRNRRMLATDLASRIERAAQIATVGAA